MKNLTYPFQKVGFENVVLTDDFWKPRVDSCSRISIPHVLKKCEKTRRLANFEIAGGVSSNKKPSKFPFDDSDVFKILEGIAYSLALTPNPALEKKTDEIIKNIELAQEEDGYLYTFRTINPESPHFLSGKHRWDEVSIYSHELYNVGHLYEAAVAYYEATGKETLLKVALKNAELINNTFGYGKIESPPGHQEIELGLVRLYMVSGDRKYLDLTKFFLDIRGSKTRKGYDEYVAQSEDKLPWLGPNRFEYNQTHQLVIDQKEAVGHAVRAVYMYSAMADMAVYCDDQKYLSALDQIWDDLVAHKLSITGGIGAKAKGEAFDKAYVLPNFYDRKNETGVYNETCASIGNIFLNHRLYQIYGHAKYIDILERTLYNGFLSGISLDGEKFFYPNPLASNGDQFRRSWFEVPCCPSNIVRFIPQIQGYIYSIKKSTCFVNLFIGSQTTVEIEGIKVELHQKTRYPWDGLVKIEVLPSNTITFTIALRIPGWCQNKPVPSDLYSYIEIEDREEFEVEVNGKPVEVKIDDKNYFKLTRDWKKGDKIQLNIPMPIRRVMPHPKVKDNIEKIAIERGPLVYCFESVDNPNVHQIKIHDNANLITEFNKDLLNQVQIIKVISQESIAKDEQMLTAIPYFAWANRGKSEMTVWVNH